jgi:hypothetical protein
MPRITTAAFFFSVPATSNAEVTDTMGLALQRTGSFRQSSQKQPFSYDEYFGNRYDDNSDGNSLSGVHLRCGIQCTRLDIIKINRQ